MLLSCKLSYCSLCADYSRRQAGVTGAEQACHGVQLAALLAEEVLAPSLPLDSQTGDLPQQSAAPPFARALKLAAELLPALGAAAVLLPSSARPRCAVICWDLRVLARILCCTGTGACLFEQTLRLAHACG